MQSAARITANAIARHHIRAFSAVSLRGGAAGNHGRSANPLMVGALAAAGAVAAATIFGGDNMPGVTPRAHSLIGPIATDTDLKSLEARIAELELKTGIYGQKTNAAFVFIKPHAVNPAVIKLVKEKFAAAGITVTGEGDLDAKTIDEQMLIDTHYGAIASKAVKLDPSELNVPPKGKAGFKKMFGMDWDQAISKKMVYNAKQACEKLGISATQLDEKWGTLKRDVNLIKFGGGFYCGKVDDIFVMNGFYMNMRSDYTTPPAAIHYMTVQWPAAALSWEDFRGKVLGGTNPAEAAEGSARRTILDQWQALGLTEKPNTGLNGVHASASPFEALAERMNWLSADASDDIYGAAMLESGIDMSTIAAWTQDPQVEFEGRKQSLFDLLEDLDAKDCLKKAQKIVASK